MTRRVHGLALLCLACSLPVYAQSVVRAKALIELMGEASLQVTGRHSAEISELMAADEDLSWTLGGDLKEQQGFGLWQVDECDDSGVADKVGAKLSCDTSHSGACDTQYRAKTGAQITYPWWAGGGPGDDDVSFGDRPCNFADDSPDVPWHPDGTPIVVDLDGRGFRFTSLDEGVRFDLDGDGYAQRTSWVAADSEDGLLALDRNGNGCVDDGTELFGDATEQPASDRYRNGFLALAVFDQPAHGGDGDGWITPADTVFPSLLLWLDDGDGLCSGDEIVPLAASGVSALDLGYRETRRRDRHGNQLRWLSRCAGDCRVVVDVIFVQGAP